ncbi:methylamine utilization protein [Pelomonas cellulosilytica]|uniref:Methylamine utilization protein n=1 Tax=Pelomonas cellulosilytica TaxID=2906762 RepID=A0ABS8XSK8_9BURK|nr:methylamine utilization protein [Pelomonas sp. P8]MCE4553872.1 methylamine utilization protein [Pelomonas sp. P8]
MTFPSLFIALTAALGPIAAFAVPVTVELRGPNGQLLADAAVAVEVKGRPARTTTAKAEMGQRDRQFAPQLLIVQTGTAVSFPNFDTVRHHVYSISPIKVIDIKLYAGTPAEPIVFDKPGVATLGCNIHDRMSAHVVVVDTPVFARTDASGRATFDLPPGEQLAKAWHAGQKQSTLQSLRLDVPTAGGSVVLTLAD